MKKTLLIVAAVAGFSCIACTGFVVLAGLLAEDDATAAQPDTAPAPRAPNPEAATLAGKLVGTWHRRGGKLCQLNDLACKMTDPGVTRHWYVFGDDGQYRYRAEYIPTTSNRLSFEEEEGTWTLEGDQLTLTPEKSQWRVHGLNDGSRKAGGPLLEEGEHPLTEVTYRAGLHFFQGLGEWNLILAPVDGAETRRDKAFAVNPDFPRAYLLSPGE